MYICLLYVFKMCPGFRLVNTKCMMLVDMWKKIQHSNSVTLREVFTTKAFGDHCECILCISIFICTALVNEFNSMFVSSRYGYLHDQHLKLSFSIIL